MPPEDDDFEVDFGAEDLIFKNDEARKIKQGDDSPLIQEANPDNKESGKSEEDENESSKDEKEAEKKQDVTDSEVDEEDDPEAELKGEKDKN